jgi:hypothetical protein
LHCQQITFTRGRVGNKNDQAWVEQKNGSVVRQLVGYDRFEGQRAYRQLAELYRAVRLKLVTKIRTGSRVRRTYGPAQTPFQRVLASGVLDVANQRRLKAVYRALDPVRLLHQLETLQEALWRHALFRSRIGPPSTAPMAVPFDLRASGVGVDGMPRDEAVGLPTGTRQRRKYRRSAKFKGPRTYRTRRDPFETVWDEVCQWLVVQPERTGRSVFDELRRRYPGQFADGQLRTLHRHIQLWRARTVLTFADDGWLDDVVEAGQSLPPPLRVSVDLGEDAEQSA